MTMFKLPGPGPRQQILLSAEAYGLVSLRLLPRYGGLDEPELALTYPLVAPPTGPCSLSTTQRRRSSLGAESRPTCSRYVQLHYLEHSWGLSMVLPVLVASWESSTLP